MYTLASQTQLTATMQLLHQSVACLKLRLRAFQAAIESFGVWSAAGDIPDIHPTSPLLNDSIHQAPLIQGCSGLVYTFWKGESLIDHYRYKAKISGKWKVRSVDIPVGNLLEVREAIAKNLGVAVIVT